MTTAKANRIRTIRDDSDENAKLPKSKPCDRPEQYDYPSKESTFMFILTTWQSWHGISDVVDEQHKYSFLLKGRRMTESQTVRRFQCGFGM